MTQQTMVTPTTTSYLSQDGKQEYSPEEKKMYIRVQSSQSLLGLVGLEGEDDSDSDFDCGDEDSSATGVSAVTEDQEVMDFTELSPSTRTSDQGLVEDATLNTTPPGSVQGPGILSLSPPRLTTYSIGSVNSASVTESLVLRQRTVQSMQQQQQQQQYHLPQVPQESPRFSRSPLVQQQLVQQQQPQPRSRPPRAPHHPPSALGGNSGGPILFQHRPVVGTVPESSGTAGAIVGGGHTRTPTDATNYSFLSSLTDATGGEYNTPRPRTLSWDNNGNNGGGGVGLGMGSKSLGVPSTPGSILQPVLLDEEEKEDAAAAARPPMSISASNLRKASPARPAPTVTTTPSSSSLNNISTSLFVPLQSLPSRENLHPLIQKLQNSSPSPQGTSFMPSLSLPPRTNLHPLIQKLKLQNASPSVRSTPFVPSPSLLPRENLHPFIQQLQNESSAKSTYTATTSETTSPLAHVHHILDEKKEDDSSRSNPMMHTQQPALLDRKNSDFTSYSSSPFTNFSLQMKTADSFTVADHQRQRASSDIASQRTTPQRSTRSSIIRGDANTEHAGRATRFSLKDILNATKECAEETDIVKDVEQNDRITSNRNGVVGSNEYYLSNGWPYFLLAWGILNLGDRGLFSNSCVFEVMNIFFCERFLYFCLGLGAATTIKRELSRTLLNGRVIGTYSSSKRELWRMSYTV